MDPVKPKVTSLIEGLQKINPRLYHAINLLTDRLEAIDEELHPTAPHGGTATTVTTSDAIIPPANFAVSSTGATVRFTWDPQPGAFQYEIRQGLVWDSATFLLRTTGQRADIDPLVYGDYNFLIKTVSFASVYSALTSTAFFSVTPIGLIEIEPRVIDNNVLLHWSTPASVFNIDYYLIYKDAVLTGQIKGTFTVFFESLSGLYTYGIRAVDVAGNVSDLNPIELSVAQPPDYVLTDSRVSALTGTRVEAYLDASVPRLLVNMDIC